jgi:hypothetical protein
MSGPKVVRIVTIEEVQAICRRLMAQVDAGGAELCRLAGQLSVRDGVIEASVAARSREMKEMFAAGRWMDLQKLAMDTLAFYPSERARLQADATARAEAVRLRRRRLADGARTIANALRAAGEEVPGDLDRVVVGASTASDDVLAEMERTVGAALSRVPTRTSDAANARAAADLAGRLSTGETTTTLAGWLSARVTAPTQAEGRLDRLMAELETLDATDATRFAEQIAHVSREESNSRRALLTDSLVLEVSSCVAEARKRDAALSTLREVLASLSTSETTAALALRGRIEADPDALSTAQADALAAEAKLLVEEEEKAAAAVARRRAVLGALSTLGYEVRETVETTWVREGRVVLKKPGATDYGVEVGAPADASRLQVRLVGADRPALPRSARRDADQETIWCGEFDRLRGQLAALGDELVVERALEAGAQPVRTVSLPATTHVEGGDRVARPQLRRSP